MSDQKEEGLAVPVCIAKHHSFRGRVRIHAMSGSVRLQSIRENEGSDSDLNNIVYMTPEQATQVAINIMTAVYKVRNPDEED
jgi:hypothetical protein